MSDCFFFFFLIQVDDGDRNVGEGKGGRNGLARSDDDDDSVVAAIASTRLGTERMASPVPFWPPPHTDGHCRHQPVVDFVAPPFHAIQFGKYVRGEITHAAQLVDD